jgi:hypothetical protein
MTNFKNFVVRKGLEVAESIKLNGKTVTSLIDSGGATSLIDSSYVQVRQVDPVSAFTTISVTGQTDIVADGDGASPIWSQSTQQTKLVASDAATQHWFGQGIAVSQDGNTAIISAEQENTTATKSGAIYVFVRSGSTWTQQAKLKASDPGTENMLGRSLDISDDGNTVVAGAPFNGGTIGAIYVWTRSGSTWSSATKIRGSDTTNWDYFGFGSSISGDGLTIAVGAMNGKKGYIFLYSGGSWSQQAAIANPTGGTHNSDFGNKCALSQDGNTMVMTARSDHALANDFDGAAYVFVRSGTSWSMQQKIQASVSEGPSAKFGESCDISWDGNTIAIGCFRCNTNSGAVFVFTRSGSTWTQEQKIQPTDIAQQDLFAITVGISGDGNSIVAGSYSEDNGSFLSAGALYAFSRSGTTWSQEIKLYSSDTASNDEFGYGVAIAKDTGTVIAGARFEAASGVKSGSAYVFTAPLSSALRDTLSIEAGTGITITTNATTDTVTIAAAGLDSAGATSLIDSSYVQARQTKYTNADFTDSAYVTTQINSVIDAAPGALDTLNELAAALGDDANFSTTITNQIAGKLDSAQTTALVDSSYVQARVTAAGGNDSATTISLIDSSYVQTRQVNPVSAFNTISVTGQTDVVADTTEVSWPLATEQQRLRSTGIGSIWVAADGFAKHVDMVGDYILAGADYADDTSYGDDYGAAFIFFRSGTTWTQQARFSISAGANYDRMGQAVSLNDDATEAIVALSHPNRIVTFTRSGTTWSEGQTLSQPSGVYVSGAYWGTMGNIRIRGNYFIVGSHNDFGASSHATMRWGSAWVYDKLGASTTLLGSSYDNVYIDLHNTGDANYVPGLGGINLGQPTGILFSGDGSKLYITHSEVIHQFNLSTAYDITTASYPSPAVTFDISGEGNSYTSIKWNNDGTKLYALNSNNHAVVGYNLSTAYDITTMSYSNTTFSLSNEMSNTSGQPGARGMGFASDGSKFFIGTSGSGTGSNVFRLYMYNMSTAYDLSTASYSNSFFKRSDAGGSDNKGIASVNFNSAGTTMFVLYYGDRIRQYNLTVPNDPTTGTVSESYNVAVNTEEGQCYDFTFNADMSKLFTVGHATDHVHQYSTSGAEPWALKQELAPSDAASPPTYYDADFGKYISMPTDSIVAIGAPTYSNNAGRVYIFERSGTTWTETHKIPSPDGSSEFLFGGDVSIDGDYLAVGAPKYLSNTGKVYIYKKVSGSWTSQTSVAASDATTGKYFGQSMHLKGDTLVIGAYAANTAYVFTRSGSTWTEVRKIVVGDLTSGSPATTSLGGQYSDGIALNRDAAVDDLVLATNGQGVHVITSGQSAIYSDTLTFAAGTGITLTTNATSDTVTIAGSTAGLDSAGATALVDSSYVQARQTKYTNADFTDSAFVTTQINSLIGGAPGTLDTLNEIAAALNDDDSAYSTLVGLISAKSDLDSSAAISLIDSDYVQARQEAVITQSATAPASPSSGDMWFDTTDTSLFVYYTDSDGSQWVDMSGATGLTGPTGPTGPTGATGTVANATQSDTAPSSPAAGDLWFDTTDATLFVYYTDSDGSQWVTVSGPAGPTGAAGPTGPVGVNWQSSIITDSAVNVSAGNGYFIDTTSNVVTASLPATASVGNAITFVDYARNWNTNNFQIHSANGTKLQSEADSDAAYNLDGQSLQLIYSGDSAGWIPISDDAVLKNAVSPSSNNLEFLVVAGGGGGGAQTGGGGGAGGYRTSSQISSVPNTVITVTVGAAGSAGNWSGTKQGGTGGSSSISGTGGITTITSAGGGGAGGYSSPNQTGVDGGSGGGGGYRNGILGGSGNTPSTSPVQGYDGGNSSYSSYNTGGGGGAGAAGVNGEAVSNGSGGEGGIGVANNITGASVYYAGGGSGIIQSSRNSLNYNPASLGGGGTGQAYGYTTGSSGTANTGGGGGGGRDANPAYSGGSGVVILKIPTSQYSGTTTGSPTVTTSGGSTIMKFTGSGSYTT